MKESAKNGFTLIEILVALAILGVIVIMCGRIFEVSSASWSTGSRKAEINMVGRGVADFIAQDISRSVAPIPTDLVISGGTLTLKVIDELAVAEGVFATPVQSVTYNFSAMTRNGTLMAPAGMVDHVELTPVSVDADELPGYVDVTVTVRDLDNTYSMDFKSRAWLANRDRYKYDDM